jgi:predicted nucleic acid-binding protein
MATTAVVDTNVLVALVDRHDKWHPHAIALRDALLNANARLVYFDCVINEAIGVIGRRTEEQRRFEQFEDLLDGLTTLVSEDNITWISVATQRLFREVVGLCRSHQGRLNFHDSLMALACQELANSGIGHRYFEHVFYFQDQCLSRSLCCNFSRRTLVCCLHYWLREPLVKLWDDFVRKQSERLQTCDICK